MFLQVKLWLQIPISVQLIYSELVHSIEYIVLYMLSIAVPHQHKYGTQPLLILNIKNYSRYFCA